MTGENRVVVSGYGMLSPLGLDSISSWNALLQGKSGIGNIQQFDTSDLPVNIGGELPNFDVEAHLSAKEARKIDRFIQYAIAAANEAVEHAGVDVEKLDKTRCGVFIGSGIGGLETIANNSQKLLEKGAKRVSPFFVPGGIINMASGTVSIRYGFKGPNLSIATACSSGLQSIALAAQMIKQGDCDLFIAGGSEAAITPLGIAGFSAARALSSRNDEPEKASRPWDKERDGFVMADGCGVLILESLAHAMARGATIYGEIVGIGLSSDAHHMTSPPEDGEGAALAMTQALKQANIDARQVAYINAHGTSTKVGDVAEVRAIKRVFKDQAPFLKVSSTKSMTGHMIGAAGAVESIFTILALRDQLAPPTINLDSPDEGCDLNFVSHQKQIIDGEYALCNSFGFGGTNGSLLFRHS